MIYYPKVTWSGAAHTLTFGTPVDVAVGQPYMEMEVVRVPGTGAQDSWTDGIFQRAKFSFRYVPSSGSASDAGWHFPSPGVRHWIEHQSQMKDNFTLYPDANSGGTHTCQFVSPPQWSREKAQPTLYRVDVEIEDVNGNAFVEY